MVPCQNDRPRGLDRLRAAALSDDRAGRRALTRVAALRKFGCGQRSWLAYRDHRARIDRGCALMVDQVTRRPRRPEVVLDYKLAGVWLLGPRCGQWQRTA